MEYRNELKYLVRANELEILKIRLDAVMQLDYNMKDQTAYNIRSIYFDDYYNSFFYENEAGVNERLKMRIRIYDKSPSLIRLEIKYKLNGLTKKESCPIDVSLCEKIMSGREISFNECADNKVLNKLYLEMKMHHLRPKLIVEYDRTAYINHVGNVRVTFDRNIRVSKYIDRLFEENAYAVPVLDSNEHVLEVKYDELLPDYIAQTLELNELRQTAFSKYYLSRKRIGRI